MANLSVFTTATVWPEVGLFIWSIYSVSDKKHWFTMTTETDSQIVLQGSDWCLLMGVEGLYDILNWRLECFLFFFR